MFFKSFSLFPGGGGLDSQHRSSAWKLHVGISNYEIERWEVKGTSYTAHWIWHEEGNSDFARFELWRRGSLKTFETSTSTVKSILLGPEFLPGIFRSGTNLNLLEFRLDLQEVFELVRRSEEERGGLPVAGDELPHRADLGGVQLVVEQRRLLEPAAVAIVQLNGWRAWKNIMFPIWWRKIQVMYRVTSSGHAPVEGLIYVWLGC